MKSINNLRLNFDKLIYFFVEYYELQERGGIMELFSKEELDLLINILKERYDTLLDLLLFSEDELDKDIKSNLILLRHMIKVFENFSNKRKD